VDARSPVIQKIYGAVKECLPKFNDYLLKEHRQNYMASIPATVDEYFRTMLVGIPGFRYVGYCMAKPYEAGRFIIQEDRYSVIDVNHNSLVLWLFNFEADVLIKTGFGVEQLTPKPVSIPMWLPYLFEQAVWLSGSRYYPIFNIMGNNMTKKKQTQDAVFYNTISFSTPIILINIYHKYPGVGAKRFHLTGHRGEKVQEKITFIQTHNNKSRIPILLYYLVKHGLVKTLTKLGFTSELIKITAEPTTDEAFMSFPAGKLGWVTAHNSCIYDNVHQCRAIITVLYLLTEVISASNVNAVMNRDTLLWRDMLGEFIHPTEDRPEEQTKQTKEHLLTADRFIGPDERQKLSYNEIYVKDFYDFCFQLFCQADYLLLQALDPKDLFNKRVEFKAQYFKPLVEVINKILFRYGASTVSLKDRDLKDITSKFKPNLLVAKISSMDNIFKMTSEVCNDNWLFNIGLSKYRSSLLRRVSGKQPDVAKKFIGAKSDPAYAAHPSQFVVESPLTLPSNPMIAGSINVYAKILPDGRFVPHDDYHKYQDMFMV